MKSGITVISIQNALKAMLLASLLCIPLRLVADVVYMSSEEFLAKTVAVTEAPEVKTVWLSGDTKAGVSDILGHKPGVLRLRYWQQGQSTAWIMEEVGKERPITIGVALEACAVTSVDVLVYRESRGDEVRYPRFTRQFIGAILKNDTHLDRHIDGISGATLSVRAMRNVVRSVLFLANAEGLCQPAA